LNDCLLVLRNEISFWSPVKTTGDPEAKADFLTMERRWLLLAHSFEFDERLDHFVPPGPRR
jgi:hypothetical protein